MASVLLVEDHHAVRESVREGILELNPKIRVVEATTYSQAVAALEEKEPFNFILTDFNYPGKNPTTMSGGSDLLQYIKDKKITTPVSVMSGRTTEQIADILAARNFSVAPDHIVDKGGDLHGHIIRMVGLYAPAPRRPAPDNGAPAPQTPKIG